MFQGRSDWISRVNVPELDHSTVVTGEQHSLSGRVEFHRHQLATVDER